MGQYYLHGMYYYAVYSVKYVHDFVVFLGLRPANERRRYVCNNVSHWLGANLESALKALSYISCIISSLASGRFACNVHVILMINGWYILGENALKVDLTNNKSKLVQVIAWRHCHCFRWWLGTNQVTGHYLNQWWLDEQRILSSNELMKIIQNQIFVLNSCLVHLKCIKLMFSTFKVEHC